MPLTSLLALITLACPSPLTSRAAPVHATAPQDDIAEATARLRAYLARNPFHGRVFDDLVSTARTLGGLGELERVIRAELDAAEDDAAGRSACILLARLAARGERLDDALELLEPLVESAEGSEGDALELRLLHGRLLLEAGRVAPARDLLRGAAEEFEGAEAAARGRDLQEELLRLLLDVEETAGDRDGVVLALERLRVVLERDHAGRLELASLFDRYELVESAEEVLNAAAEEAREDAARSCDALAALGRLRERAGRGDEALEAYDAALGQLAPGHWLRVELLERAIRLRLLGGTLEPWLDATRASAASGDLGPGLDLARALEISGRQEQAAETLAALRERHPAHEDLGTRLVRAARAAGRLDLAADELQRRVGARPGNALAQLELATALADLGADDGATRALRRALELAKTSEDMGVAVRVGRAAFAKNDLEFGRTAFERAAELRPDEPTPLIEFARVERDDGRLEPLMERALERADGDELLEVARAWDDFERPDAAERTLRTALDDEVARPQALAALATRIDEAGDSVAAAELWLTLASESQGSRRNDALDRFVSCHDGADAKRAALETWTERARAADESELLAWGIVARLRSALNDPLRSSMAWREVVHRTPDDVTARRALAAQLGFARKFDEALVELGHLIELDSAQRALHLLERARLLGEAGRTESALADLARVAVESRTNPDLLRRAAARCQALGYPERARPLYERVLRLDPEDGRTARTLARLEQEAGDRARARELLLVAWQNTEEGAERTTILRDLQSSLRRGPERDEFLDRVVARVLASRYDRDALDLALELLPWARRFEDLERVADTLLERAPEALAGLHARSQARTAQGDTEGAVADVHALVARGEDIDEVLAGLSEALRASEALDADTARAFGALSGDAEAQAKVLSDAGCKALAAAYLAGDVDARGLPNDGRLDLLVAHKVYVDAALAIQSLAALNERDGETVVRTHALGLLHYRNGNPEGAAAMGERLFEIAPHEGMVKAYFDTIEAPETYQKLVAERGEK